MRNEKLMPLSRRCLGAGSSSANLCKRSRGLRPSCPPRVGMGRNGGFSNSDSLIVPDSADSKNNTYMY